MTYEQKFQEILEFQGMYKNGFSALYLAEEQIDILIEYVWELREQVQELEESCNIGNCLSKFTNKTETDNKRYQEALEKIKDNSSCVVAFGYAVKALEDSK